MSWVTTTDHKQIGILYLVTYVRVLHPRRRRGADDPPAACDANNTLVSRELYNQLFTMHGTTMVFLFVVPMLVGFGNYLVPLMIGARDMAFPRLNALPTGCSWLGGVVLYVVDLLAARPKRAGRATRR